MDVKSTRFFATVYGMLFLAAGILIAIISVCSAQDFEPDRRPEAGMYLAVDSNKGTAALVGIKQTGISASGHTLDCTSRMIGFDGNGYLYTAWDANYAPASDFTMIVWVRSDSWNPTSYANRHIMGSTIYSAGQRGIGMFYILANPNGGQPAAYATGMPPGQYHGPYLTGATTTWTHLAFIHYGSRARTYANGVQVGDTIYTYDNYQGSFGIGNADAFGANQTFRGQLYIPRFYNRAFTAEEVASDIISSKQGIPSP